MTAGRNDRVIEEVLADLTSEGGLERREEGQRRAEPVGGIGKVEGFHLGAHDQKRGEGRLAGEIEGDLARGLWSALGSRKGVD